MFTTSTDESYTRVVIFYIDQNKTSKSKKKKLLFWVTSNRFGQKVTEHWLELRSNYNTYLYGKYEWINAIFTLLQFTTVHRE